MDEEPNSPAITREPGAVDGSLLAIYISPGHSYWGRQGEGRMQHGILAPASVECVAGEGLRGDRYFGHRKDSKGQVTFFDQAVVEAVRQQFKLPRLPASVFRRNLLVAGMDLKSLLGRRFIFQGIAFEGAQECRPCDWMNRVVEPGTEAFLKQEFRGGLRAKILSHGVLHLSSAE